jgi:hypothetical protein
VEAWKLVQRKTKLAEIHGIFPGCSSVAFWPEYPISASERCGLVVSAISYAEIQGLNFERKDWLS